MDVSDNEAIVIELWRKIREGSKKASVELEFVTITAYRAGTIIRIDIKEEAKDA